MADDSNNPQAGAGRPLPKKEADLFRSVVKHFESKQYKKAIKSADTILKRFPTHGETLAMKGLTLNAINYSAKREEAHELVKKALRFDMRSHVCWHVYGLLHRSDRNYNEAIKAYKQALRLDPHNQQILRDLSMLQIQMRDVDGFCQTRNALLNLKPNAKVNWMAFALSKHLAGDHRDAVKVIDIYLGTLTEQSEELGRCFESSELALYKNRILAEIPDNWREALEHLNVCEAIVVDRTSWLMTKAEYQLALRDYVGAKQTVAALLDRGMTEDYRVHTLFMCVLLELDDWNLIQEALRLRGTRTLATWVPLSDEERDRIRDAYANELLPQFPSSYAVQTIPMTLLPVSSTALRDALSQRCRKGLTKGVPSLCAELQSFMWIERNGRYVRPDDPMDYAIHPVFCMVVELVDAFIACLEAESKFASSDENEEPPSTILWAWYLRAGLCELSGDYTAGLDWVEKCLNHTPTACELYELQARLLQASGDVQQAAECLDKAREFDKQDRYMNNLTTRYLLLAGREEQALKTISMFAKHEGNPEQNLFDMQCSWYELELAAHHARRQEWGKSLKKYAAVVKHFEDINEDQFDFHGYCLRKVTLRAYVEVLRFEDEAYGQDYYCQAAIGMINIYLHLMDRPSTDDSSEPDYSAMTAAERKKAKAIARKKKKAAEKKEEEEAAAAAGANKVDAKKDASKDANGSTTNHNHASSSNKAKGNTASGGKPSFVEQDPLGKELLAKDPTEEATKYSATLTRYAPKRLDTWLLSYDVSIRRNKPLLALRALFQARSVDASNGEVLWRIVDFGTTLPSMMNSSLNEVSQRIVKDEFPALLNHQSLESFVSNAVDAVRRSGGDGAPSVSLAYRVAVAKAVVRSQTRSVAEACQLVTQGGLSGRGVSVDACRQALRVLQSFGDEAHHAAELWMDMVKVRFPLLSDLS